MENLEVIFRGATPTISGLQSKASKAKDSLPLQLSSDTEDVIKQPNTCRILQRKLELKVERAKRNYSQYQETNVCSVHVDSSINNNSYFNPAEIVNLQKRKSQSSTLIPISRLPIPGDQEQKPLVDYKSDRYLFDFESYTTQQSYSNILYNPLHLISDECEEISFFPEQQLKGRSKRHAELSDTFSIQEMTIDSDLESNDSQSLELLTPRLKRNFIDYLATCFCFQPSS